MLREIKSNIIQKTYKSSVGSFLLLNYFQCASIGLRFRCPEVFLTE